MVVVVEKVYLSTRRGAWVGGRVGDNGMPIDMLLGRRALNAFVQCLPQSAFNGMAEKQVRGKSEIGKWEGESKRGKSERAK